MISFKNLLKNILISSLLLSCATSNTYSMKNLSYNPEKHHVDLGLIQSKVNKPGSVKLTNSANYSSSKRNKAKLFAYLTITIIMTLIIIKLIGSKWAPKDVPTRFVGKAYKIAYSIANGFCNETKTMFNKFYSNTINHKNAIKQLQTEKELSTEQAQFLNCYAKELKNILNKSSSVPTYWFDIAKQWLKNHGIQRPSNEAIAKKVNDFIQENDNAAKRTCSKQLTSVVNCFQKCVTNTITVITNQDIREKACEDNCIITSYE